MKGISTRAQLMRDIKENLSPWADRIQADFAHAKAEAAQKAELKKEKEQEVFVNEGKD